MANTVIAIRSSGVTGNTPSLGVLANGELSLNFADGILYYKTSSNTLGSIRTTQPAGLTTEVQFNDSGSFGANANFTFNKTLATLNVKNINVSTNLIATAANLTVNNITTGTGVGGIIAGANVIYSNTFVANTGGITTTGNSSLNGIVTVNYNVGAASSQNAAIEMYGANTKGGTGYFDFLAANNISAGTTNRNKWFRVDSNGKFQIINSAYTVNIFDLNDSGYLTIPGGLATSQYIQFSDGSRQYTANAGGALSNTQILAGLQTVSPTANITFDTIIVANNGIGRSLRIGDDAWIGDVNLSDTIAIRGAFNTANAYIVFGSADTTALGRAGSGALTYGGNTVWHAGNDGAGSGLDADLLDGLNSSSFANATFANTDYTTISATAGVYGNASYVPVTTLTANGRVSSITNTAIAIDTAAITSGILSNTRGGTGVTTSTGTGAVVLNTSPTLSTPTVDRVDWPAVGYAPPSLTTRSSGTKLTLYPSLSSTSVDYAIGIDGGVLWSSVPAANTNYTFKWYGGESQIASLSGDGTLTAISANITSTTSSTSKTTGALKIAGGVGIAGDLFAGNSIVVDSGAYGNVTISQFASVWGQAYGTNPYSIMQVRSSDFATGMGMQVYTGLNGLLYSNTGIQFKTSANVRDKDYSTGGTNAGQFAANGAFIAQASLASTSNATGSIQVVGGIGVKGNVSANGIIFDDGTRQTTAATAGASIGDVLALAIALG